ncbi:MAG: hypothetical protein KDA60_07635 [Planctomycetales bacterium]|nr:hypothetical protein [Planctomycetales bacterium]
MSIDRIVGGVAVLLVLGINCGSAATIGMVDDFENGKTQGWIHGTVSPNPPQNIADGGPAGTGDHYLQVTSTGTFGAGSRLAALNRSQWTGDLLAAGITAISADVTNLGNEDLNLRLAFTSNTTFTAFATTHALVVPAHTDWQAVTFDITNIGLTRVQGTGTFEATMAAVDELRIITAQNPGLRADIVAGELGIDNIMAMPEPASVAMLWMGLVAGGNLLRRRR